MWEQDYARQPDDTARAIWRYLDAHAASYPLDGHVGALRPPSRAPRGATWVGLELVTAPRIGDACPELLGAVTSLGGSLALHEGSGQDDDPARLARFLFTHARRGARYVVADGARFGLHVLWRRCAARWVELGYRLAPCCSGTAVRFLTVRRGGQSWHVVDFGSLVGVEDDDPDGLARMLAGPAFACSSPAAVVAVAVEVYEQAMVGSFGVRPGLTAGRTAIDALARHVPHDAWLWKPSVLAVTLCRIGGGFRGGYCYYPAYRGPGHAIDLRRAYTWALSKGLPNGSSLGPCRVGAVEQPGVYVCRLRGRGDLPVYVAPYLGPQSGFTRRLWSGDDCHCVLYTAEFAGLRALGYVVEPGWGARYRATVDIAGFTTQAEAILRLHGAESGLGRIVKGLANRVYGKLAERPEQDDVVFSRASPGGGALPMLDANGDELKDAWSTTRTAHRRHQHVDVAGEITARVRGRLYGTIAHLHDSGVRVLAADTDGLVVDRHPAGAVRLDSLAVGAWRYQGYDPNVVINGPRFAVINGRVLTAGTSPQERIVVELAHDRGTVQAMGKVMAPPWEGGALRGDVIRTLRRQGVREA